MTFTSANVLYVLAGSLLFGVSSGALGCFAFLRRRALLGDAIAHAALPGMCLAFLLTQSKDLGWLILGAASTGLLGSLAVNAIPKVSRIKEDAAIALVLSVFFGFGIVLLTVVQHSSGGNQSGLDKFLFGQAASMMPHDVQVFGSLAIVLLVALALAYKELKLTAFDSAFAESIGISVRSVDLLLTLLIVVVVTVGLQAVGVVLMAAMLITPPAAARQWTDRLPVMICLSAAFGGAACIAGTLISATAPRMPTGPWIVVMITVIFAVSMLAAPRRGAISRIRQQQRTHARIRRENVLKTLYRLEEDTKQSEHSIDWLLRYRALTLPQLHRTLRSLLRSGLVNVGKTPDSWKLTETGRLQAQRLVRLHRLWEMYLTQYLHLSQDRVHADAEEIEHLLTPELEEKLTTLLQHPTHDPHSRRIPYDNASNSEGKKS